MARAVCKFVCVCGCCGKTFAPLGGRGRMFCYVCAPTPNSGAYRLTSKLRRERAAAEAAIALSVVSIVEATV